MGVASPRRRRPVTPPLAVNEMSVFGVARPNCARSAAFGSTSRFTSSPVRLLSSVLTSLLSASVATGSTSAHAPLVLRSRVVSPFAVTRSSSTSSMATVNTFSLVSVSVFSASTK